MVVPIATERGLRRGGGIGWLALAGVTWGTSGTIGTLLRAPLRILRIARFAA